MPKNYRIIQYLLLTLAVGVLIFISLSKKPLCFESGIVGEIAIKTASGASQVFDCKSNKSAQYNEEIVELIKNISPRLKKIDLFLLKK